MSHQGSRLRAEILTLDLQNTNVMCKTLKNNYLL
jgi:hypothetical protein